MPSTSNSLDPAPVIICETPGDAGERKPIATMPQVMLHAVGEVGLGRSEAFYSCPTKVVSS